MVRNHYNLGQESCVFWFSERSNWQWMGWRYKVRILGDNSNVDNVTDGELSYAFALLPTTAGSGGV